MPRVKSGTHTRRHHNKTLKAAKGYWGARSRLIRTASQAVDTAMKYSTRDRRARKRDFRALWIARISAALANLPLSYSVLISKLSKAKIGLNRKMLSEIAIQDPAGFQAILKSAQS